MRRAVPLLLLAMAAAATLIAADKKTLSISIEMDPSVPGKEGALWLGYLMARANYINQHADDYPVGQPGRLAPTFDEEVEARKTAAQIYRELKASSLDVPYFNGLVLVDDAGFLREYVWTCLKDSSWSQQPAGLRLSEFDSWRSKRLRGHRPQTYGGISVR